MFLPPPNIDKKTGGKLGRFAILNDTLRAVPQIQPQPQPQPAK